MKLINYFLVIVFFCCFSQTVNASSTRVHTLGDDGKFISDVANVRMFPSLLSSFSNEFAIEIGKLDQKMLGIVDPVLGVDNVHIHLGLLEFLHLGLWYSEYNENQMFNIMKKGGFYLPETDDFKLSKLGANRQFDIILSMPLSFIKLGLNIIYGSASYDRSPGAGEKAILDKFNQDAMHPDDKAKLEETLQAEEKKLNDVINDNLFRGKDSVSLSNVGFGLGASVEFGRFQIDSGFRYLYHGFNYMIDGKSWVNNQPGHEVGLDLRTSMKITDTLIGKVYLGYDRFKTWGKQTPKYFTYNGIGIPYDMKGIESLAYYTMSDTYNKFNFGLHVQYVPVEKINLFFSAGLEYINNKINTYSQNPDWTDGKFKETNFDSTILILPYLNGGIEYNITSWLTLRSGVFKKISGETNKTTARGTDYKVVTEEKYTLVPELDDKSKENTFAYFIGAGFEYERLKMDFDVCPEYFLKGPYVLSGSGADMFMRASVTYNW